MANYVYSQNDASILRQQMISSVGSLKCSEPSDFPSSCLTYPIVVQDSINVKIDPSTINSCKDYRTTWALVRTIGIVVMFTVEAVRLELAFRSYAEEGLFGSAYH